MRNYFVSIRLEGLNQFVYRSLKVSGKKKKGGEGVTVTSFFQIEAINRKRQRSRVCARERGDPTVRRAPPPCLELIMYPGKPGCRTAWHSHNGG